MGERSEENYADLLRIAVKMRQALSLMCDGTYGCTCTICRAAWGFDHHILEYAEDEDVSEVQV
jgi:hypothetical protein